MKKSAKSKAKTRRKSGQTKEKSGQTKGRQGIPKIKPQRWIMILSDQPLYDLTAKKFEKYLTAKEIRTTTRVDAGVRIVSLKRLQGYDE
jgi:hypothetical protein